MYVQIVRGSSYYQLSRQNIIRVVALEAPRGKIFDRNGNILADTKLGFSLSVIPQEMGNSAILFRRLASLLNVDLHQIYQKYAKNYLSPFAPAVVIDSLSKEQLIIVEEYKLLLPGILIESKPQRVYPYGSAGAHAIGYVGEINQSRITRLKSYGYAVSDEIGYSGVEEYYDILLRGEKGGEQVEVDSSGRRIRLVGYRPPTIGENITTTIDAGIQEIVDKEMQDRVGAVVIMDPYNGEIVALGSYPEYDPNVLTAGPSSEIQSILCDPLSPLLNRAIAGQYPPGSTFKVITATAALEKDLSLQYQSFYCDGSMMIGGRRFHCLHHHGEQTLDEGLVHSCNVYFYRLGILIGPDRIVTTGLRFGLGQLTDIDLKNEKSGFLPSVNWKKLVRFQGWYDGDTANLSIGQGETLITPLQQVRLISAFANGGFLVRPHLIKAVGKKRIQFSAGQRLDVSEETRYLMNQFLARVVDDDDGTARAARVEGLRMYAKTGTAQAGRKAAHAWLIGYVGDDQTKYAFCIFVEHGVTSYYAAVIAHNIFSEMKRAGYFSS